jgi:hypothetical protein
VPSGVDTLPPPPGSEETDRARLTQAPHAVPVVRRTDRQTPPSAT